VGGAAGPASRSGTQRFSTWQLAGAAHDAPHCPSATGTLHEVWLRRSYRSFDPMQSRVVRHTSAESPSWLCILQSSSAVQGRGAQYGPLCEVIPRDPGGQAAGAGGTTSARAGPGSSSAAAAKTRRAAVRMRPLYHDRRRASPSRVGSPSQLRGGSEEPRCSGLTYRVCVIFVV
jgi:hypothetical protein